MSRHSIQFTHLIVALLLALPRSLSAANAPAIAEADVIVYGSTPGGFCAAIAAAREGATVILLCLTANPDNRVPFPKPDNYDAAQFEIVRRYLEKGGRVGFDLYQLPNGKLDGNNSIGGQFSLGMVGACNGWSQADAAKRAAIWEAHKQYTLEFYYFLTTDPTVRR